MSIFEKMKQKPFSLTDADIAWVKEKLDGLSLEDKVGQLFCLIARGADDETVEEIFNVCKPGGAMYRPMTAAECVSLTEKFAKTSDIPMLIPANLEKGGNGLATEGTMMGSPTAVAAAGKTVGDAYEYGRRLGEICGAEGSAVGGNWAFAPIIDIDYNFRNPITNTRTFGSEPEIVRAAGRGYVEAVQKYGVAASIKHFPGDGMDERDQHLVTSINSMSCEDWDKTYGMAYKDCIDAGAMTVMIGHIMQPEYSRKLIPGIKDEDIMPATLAPELMNGLLREKLGFNGLIVTDATTMVGFTLPMGRAKAVPYSIAAGADMFLFTRNLAEDYGYMMDGIKEGVITEERLNEAVARVLGLKAALGLNKNPTLPTLEEAMKVVGCKKHKDWAADCADKAITLVKEEKGVLPITPAKYKRILYYPIEAELGVAYSVRGGVCDKIHDMLEAEGFELTTFTPEGYLEGRTRTFSDITDNYDAIIYVANLATKSNQTTVRIEWAQPMGANCPIYVNSVPTVFISVENPYHLLDVPRVKTFINTYCSTDESIKAVVDKLVGRSEFVGKSPIDPFCGMWDTRL